MRIAILMDIPEYILERTNDLRSPDWYTRTFEIVLGRKASGAPYVEHVTARAAGYVLGAMLYTVADEMHFGEPVMIETAVISKTQP